MLGGDHYSQPVPRRSPVTIAIDAGTTGVRALVVDEHATVVDVAYRELTQHFPRPGWVEHDAAQIWDQVRATLAEVVGRLPDADAVVAAIGVTNQRETVVSWDRRTGAPLHRAIVWQDRRTAPACAELEAAGHLPLVRERTGLVLDPYFSASKMAWLLHEGGVAAGDDLVLGTVDAWVLWNLTGGTDGGVLATDVTNASRTMLFDIVTRRWSPELLDLFGVPAAALPEVRPSCGRFGRVAAEVLGPDAALAGVAVSGVAGDQHAALFGQACFDRGMAKSTFGTGAFVLVHAGSTCPPPVDGLLTTVAWDLGDGAIASGRPGVAYALEGSVLTSGAGIQWLRDGLGVLEDAAETETIARSVDSTDGVVVVPAFTGLGSPYWDPAARGTIVGISRGTGRAHLVRAMVEGMASSVSDVLDAMAVGGTAPTEVRADGGASVMDLLLQLLADRSGVRVVRPRSVETTAIGAAAMAGLSEGVWGTLDDLAACWSEEGAFEPATSRAEAEGALRAWRSGLDRSRGWAAAD